MREFKSHRMHSFSCFVGGELSSQFTFLLMVDRSICGLLCRLVPTRKWQECDESDVKCFSVYSQQRTIVMPTGSCEKKEIS